MNGVGLGIESLASLQTRRARRRLITHSGRDRHVIELRRDILLQIIHCHVVHARRFVPGMQDRLPLDKAGWRHSNFGVLLQIDSRPCAPIPVGIVYISTTGK